MLFILFWWYHRTIVKPVVTIIYAEMKVLKTVRKGKDRVKKKKDESHLGVLRTLQNIYSEVFLRKYLTAFRR